MKPMLPSIVYCTRFLELTSTFTDCDDTLLNIMGRRFTELYKVHELSMNTHTVVGRRRRHHY